MADQRGSRRSMPKLPYRTSAWTDQQRAPRACGWLLDGYLSLIIVAPRSEAAFCNRDRVVGEVTCQHQRRTRRSEMIMMERGHRIRCHLPYGVGLATAHPRGSLGLLEDSRSEGDARGLSRVGLCLFDFGQPELYVAIDVALGE